VYGTATLLSPLVRRWRRFTRLRRRLLQGAVGAVGVLLIAVPPRAERIWHDVGLAVLVFAITLPVWRAPEESLPDPLRFRELHRRVCRRAATGLLLSGTLALIANRWLNDRQDSGGAHIVAGCGTLLACLSLVPVLLERPIWRLWPASLRQAAATAEVLGKISRNHPPDRDRTIAGLPNPVLHRPAGPPSASACATPGRKRSGTHPAVLRWDSHHLSISDGHGYVHPIPVAGREADAGLPHHPALRPVSEIVWCGHTALPAYGFSAATLLLLDADGRRCATLARPPFGRNDVAKVARAAGVAFTAHDLTFADGSYQELMSALFPARGKQFELYG